MQNSSRTLASNDSSRYKQIVHVRGKPHRVNRILADVNIPYKLAIDRRKNALFFCINADEFSDQSFHSVVTDLKTGVSTVVPGIRNGFASAVDHKTSTVYLGGSDGIHKFNYNTNNVKKLPLVSGTDIFDMYFHKDLYYVDTANQNLYVYKDMKPNIIPELKGCLIHHFVIDKNEDLIFINSKGLHVLPKGAVSPYTQVQNISHMNFRGVTTDVDGRAYFIAQDGVYTFDSSKRLTKILALENGYGLAFDRDNNMIYSDERTVNKLTPL